MTDLIDPPPPAAGAGGADSGLEIDRPPVFQPNTKVRARTHVRNDGTHPTGRIGDVLVYAGDIGYVRDVGTFLQRAWIYEVDFISSRRVVGMRAAELEAVDPPAAASDAIPPAAEAAAR